MGPIRGGVVRAPAPSLVEVTGVDGVEHLVRDEAMAAGRLAGRYRAVCDAEVYSASLAAAPCELCRSCARYRRAVR